MEHNKIEETKNTGSQYSKIPVRANIMQQDEMIQRIIGVTKIMADVVGSTIGPYGQNSLIQTVDKLIMTKDGYNISYNIDFDTYLDNAIKSMVTDVAKVILDSVGDGTSSSIVSSHHILLNLYTRVYGKYSIREIEDAIKIAIDRINAEIYSNATKLTDTNMADILRKIALVATNWNEELSDCISNIYKETGNPVIKLLDGNSNSTHVEILTEKYDIAGQVVIDDMMNDTKIGGMSVENPYVMVFNHNVPYRYAPLLTNLASKIFSVTGRRLCIVAPNFDGQFIQICKDSHLSAMSQDTPAMGYIIPVKVFRTNDYDRDCIDDLTLLLGCNVISPENDTFKIFSTEAHRLYNLFIEQRASGKDEDETMMSLVNVVNNTHLFLIDEDHLGRCGKLQATKSEIRLTSPSDKFSKRIEDRINSLQSEIDAIESDFKSKAESAVRIKMKKQRLGKLKCKMGIIYVGGYGSADLKAKRDALDDAIRACETVFMDGYVTEGSSLSIPHAIKSIVLRDDEKGLLLDIYDCIYEAFVEGVLKCLISNKMPISDFEELMGYRVDSIPERTSQDKLAFDLVKCEIDTARNVINPARTDTEILKAAMRIVLSGLTSNQLLFKRFDEHE